MLTLSASETVFLQQATERAVAIRVDIVQRSNGALVRRIEHTADDILDDEQLSIIGGSVRVDTSADVLRSLSLEIGDPNHEITIGLGGLFGLDKYIRVYKGYRIDAPWGSGAYTYWPLGVFVLNGNPEIDAEGGRRVVRIQAGDKTCLANKQPRGGLLTAYRVSQGTAKRAAIQTIAQYQTWGETQFNLTTDSTATVGWDLPFTAQQSPWEIAKRLNEIVEPNGKITRLLYDPNGALTLSVDPGPSLNDLPAVWTIQPVSDGLSQLIGARLVADVFKLRNACRVNWGSSRVTPGTVLDYDNDPSSPTYVGSIGYLIEEWKGGQLDDLIRNSDEALARAKFQRQSAQSYQERVPLTILENPALEPWDVVQVTETQADINAKYQLLSFTINLDNNLTMSAEGWRVRALA